jgi:DNA-directed RNA polymerase sigma subunit (sigma70/sigma32)
VSTTSPTRTKSSETIEYTERNRALFSRRQKLVERLERLEQRRERTKAAKVRRELDRVDSEIVSLNRGLVRAYVRRFTSHTTAADSADFEAAGLLGLMKSIASYDPELGTFASWAYHPIKREVISAVRVADHANMTAGDFERRPQIKRAEDELSVDGATPTLDEVAEKSGVPVEQVRRILQAPRIGSLSVTYGDGDDDVELGDLLADESADPLDRTVRAQSVSGLEEWGLSVLEQRELFVIVRRFGLDGEPPQRLSTIGKALNLSRETARQLESKALSRLSHPITLRRLLLHDAEGSVPTSR